MTPAALDALLKPRSIALIGASPREDSVGFRVARNLRLMGFARPIYGVNPRYKEAAGIACYPSLAELPEPVDAVFCGVPASQGPELVEAVGRAGIRAMFINASGFADGGPEGRALQDRLEAAAHEYGIALAGPNNMGLINVLDGFAAWTARYMTPIAKGPVAILSQSGSIALAISEDERQLGLAYVVTCGNEAVVTVAHYLDRVVRDPRVKVVLLFIEMIRAPALFAAAAREAARRGVRIVAIKAGASERGQRMVAAHTGSLAGNDVLYGAFFEHLGVIRVHEIDEMLETAVLLVSHTEPPPNAALVPVSVSGGESALLADLGTGLGLDLPPLSAATLERLRPAFPDFATPANPLDAWGLGFNRERFRLVIEALLGEPAIGTIPIAIDAPAKGGADVPYACAMAEVCAALVPATDKKLVFFNHSAGGGPNAEVKAILDRARLPYLSGMRSAMLAIRHFVRPTGRGNGAPEPAVPAPVPVDRLIAADEPDRFAFMTEHGVPMVRCERGASPAAAVAAAAALGYPVVLKGTAPVLAHKSELGLVHLGLADAAAVVAAYEAIAARLAQAAPADGVIEIQPMLGDGVELIIAVRNAPGFGSLVVVGVGGTLVELVAQSSARLGPLSQAEALAMLDETAAGRLLGGLRGRGPYDRAAAAGAIAALSRLGAATVGELAVIEVNPLIVLRQGVAGVDLVLEPPSA